MVNDMGLNASSAAEGWRSRTAHAKRLQPRLTGFTLIELMVVQAVMALLSSLVIPRYLERVDDAREVVLKQNLVGVRVAIDQFYRDRAQYPDSLAELVNKRYIRELPVDPITQRTDTWTIITPSGTVVAASTSDTTVTASTNGSAARVFDLKSGASGAAKDGSAYASW